MSSIEAARLAAEAKCDEQDAMIATLQHQLALRQDELQALTTVDATDDSAMKVAQYRATCEKNPRSIAAEDAFDTIVRLENTLKIEQRRNAMLVKENKVQRLNVLERRKFLDRLTQQYDELCASSGVSGVSISSESRGDIQSRIAEMQGLIATMTQEHRAAALLVKKKEQLILFLEDDLHVKKQLGEKVSMLHNDIRVADEECRRAQVELDHQLVADRDRDRALVKVECSRDAQTLVNVSSDNTFLHSEVSRLKGQKQEQDRLIKQQVKRCRQLTSRYEMLTAAMRDLKIDVAIGRGASSSALVEAAAASEESSSGADSEDVLPIALYELLHRDHAALTDMVSRKEILHIEKQSVIMALNLKLSAHAQALRSVTNEQVQRKSDKVIELQQLHGQLEEKHKDFRSKIVNLMCENLELKKPVKTSSGRPATAPK